MSIISQGKLALLGVLLVALSVAVPAGFTSANEDAAVRTADVVGIDLLDGDGIVRLEIGTRGAVTHRSFRMTGPDRFVVDVMGAIYRADSEPIAGDGTLVHQVRSSQYKVMPVPITRVVVELADGVVAKIENHAGGLAVVLWPEGAQPEAAIEMPAAEFGLGAAPMTGLGSAHTTAELGDELTMDRWQTDPQVAQPVRREDDASYARTFSVNTQNADIQTILRSIADFSGMNVITSPRVQGAVTVALTDVPWRDAMDVILRAHGFGYVEESDVLRVDTLEKLREEEIAQKTAEQRIDAIEQLTTTVVPVDFANADEVRLAVESMSSQRGSVEVETRTNALVVTDIPSVVEMISNLARTLDSQTPQVHIDALLLDLDTQAQRDLGIQWGVTNFKAEGSNIVGDVAVDAGLANPVTQLRLGGVQDWGDLRVAIQALEKTNKATIISNPTVTTTDNREAEILVGQKIPLIVADEAGNAITELTTIGVRLIVTPHINSENQITLDVHPEVSDLSSQATVQGGVIINTSEADTRVLVNNGETAVIAGLIRNVQTKLRTGVPVLKDIPLLGFLFRSENIIDAQRELVVFITPSIVENPSDLYNDRDRQRMDTVDELIEKERQKIGS